MTGVQTGVYTPTPDKPRLCACETPGQQQKTHSRDKGFEGHGCTCPPRTPLTFVERLPGLTKAGEHRTRTHTHHLCACDVCGEVTWIATNHFARRPCLSCDARKCNKKAVCCDDCRHRVGLKCRMTPGCAGFHLKPEDEP